MMAQLEPLLERWRQLQPREQLILAAGTVIAVVLLGWALLVSPILVAREDARAALSGQRQLAIDLEIAASRFGNVGNARQTSSANLTLIAVVDRSIRGSRIGKPASRLQPDGETRARVWLEDVNFDAMVAWLAELESRYGVRIDTADIDRSSGAGLVDVRLTLVRP